MSNNDDHKLAGTISGLLTGIFYQIKRHNEGIKQTPGEVLFNVAKCTIIGRFAANLPDVIEPADNPNHRRFAHSLLSAGVISYAEFKMIESGEIPIWLEEMLASVGNGYLSHLLLDSKTPMGLPLLG